MPILSTVTQDLKNFIETFKAGIYTDIYPDWMQVMFWITSTAIAEIGINELFKLFGKDINKTIINAICKFLRKKFNIK